MMHKCISIDFVNETFRAFIESATGNKSMRSLAVRAGLDPSKLHRQLQGELKVETVVLLCRANGISLLEAFVAAHFITQNEADTLGVLSSLRQATDRDLVEEMLRRVVDAEDHPTLTEPVDSKKVNELAAKRQTRLDVSRYEEDELPADEKLAANRDKSAGDSEPELP